MSLYKHLKGQCVGMEAMQSQWFHWQWNNNETKDLHGFIVHANVAHTQLGRPQKYTEGWGNENKRINKTFVKRRKLWVNLSESVWYVVEQYGKRTERNISTHIDNGPPAGIHS